MKRRHFLTLLGAAAPFFLTSSPARAFDLFKELGDVIPEELTPVLDSGKKIASGFEDITPEQEYYIGRSVSAVILSRYKTLNRPKPLSYVNVMGTALSQASNRPETFGGYHFQILDTDEVNALSAPGGFIFVSKGLLKCCATEDAMAAVLAHEIGHVQRQHGLQAIQDSRITDGLTTLALHGSATLGGKDLKKVTLAFDDSIKDITTTMIDNGYSRAAEEEADLDAVTIMERLGYDPNYIIDMLVAMKRYLTPGSTGFASTHPSPATRIETVKTALGGYTRPRPSPARGMRFVRMTGGM